jgi:hypothetical protein
MIVSVKLVPSIALAGLLGLGCLALGGNPGQAETIPPSTAIPVIFTQTLEAGKAGPGATVIAKTTEAVYLPGGQVLPKGTTLIGHVVESAPFHFNPAPYAVQTPSALSVHFDKIAEGGSTLPVSLEVRAISGPVAAHEASILHFRDETDTTGTRTLIGGSEYSPLESEVLSPDGDIVGYNRAQGVFARLLARDYVVGDSTLHCEATSTEQSLGIFSANACGVYGLDEASMPENGSKGDGAFVLESRHETVKLYAGSAALLQVTGAE